MEIKSSEFFRNMKSLPPEGTDEFKQLVDWEVEKITGGVTINGVFISGWLYWHLNHWWIRVDDIDEYGNIVRKPQLPELRDNEWIRAEYLEQCRVEKKGYLEIGGRQSGKALLNSSLLYKDGEEIEIGKCSIGDRIFDDAGKLTTITGKFPQGIRPVYKLTLIDKRVIYCDEDHKWLVRDRLSKRIDKKKVLTVKEMLTTYKRHRPSWKNRKNSFEFKYAIPNNGAVEYSTKNLKIDPYFLGLWLGDGSNSYSKITTVDKEIEVYIRKYAESLGLGVVVDDVDTFMITTGLNGGNKEEMKTRNMIHQFLKPLYNNKHIPDEYLYSDINQRFELLKGLMDTDGCCDISGSVTFSSSNQRLAKDFYKLCRSLGIPVRVDEKKSGYKKNGEYIECKKSFNFVLYTDLPIFKLTRKLNRRRSKPKYKNWTPIIDISYVGRKETTCITVDNDSHLFLTDNYTPTHNSEGEASYFGMNSTIFENTQNLIVCGNDDDLSLLKDKVDFGLKRLWKGIAIPRLDKTWRLNQIRLGYKDSYGEDQIWSYIIIRNARDGHNTEAGAGTTAKTVIFDEVGKYPFASSFKAVEPAIKSKFGWRTTPWLTGTGGSFQNGKDAENFFYNPDSNNFLSVQAEDGKAKTAIFLSGLYRLDCKEDMFLGDWLRLRGLVIDDVSELNKITIAVSNKEKANALIEQELEQARHNPDRTLYLKQKMYYPRTVDECFLRDTQNIFDTEAAKRQKFRLTEQGRTGTPVILIHDGEKIVHEFTDKQPITNFPLRPNDSKDAPVVIYEFPVENPPYGLYVAGCLPPGEKVLTDKGLKSIENVTFSDRLINEKGEFVDITNLQRYYKSASPIFDLKVHNSLRSTKFTGEHPILISDANGNNAEPVIESRFSFSYIHIRDVKIGQWIKYPNIFKRQNPFDIDVLWDNKGYRIDKVVNSPLKNKDFWWFVGLFMGDGWCESNGYKITISLNKKEYKTIDRLTSIIRYLFDRGPSTREKNSCIEISFSCQQLNSFLSNHIERGAVNKSLPDWVKRIDSNYKYELILGYLDSDGCVCREKKRGYFSIEFVSVSLELLEDMQDVLFSIGYVSNLTKLRDVSTTKIKKGRISNTRKTYHLRIGNNDTIKFWKHFDSKVSHKLSKISSDKIVETVSSPKKGCFISEDEEYVYFKISKLNVSIYSGWVYNFECYSHTYLCKNITTHNCDPYRQGQASYSTSLGAVYIYKRMHSLTGEKFQDMFVASYCARPEKKETWEEQARLLIKYYNARTLCENDDISFIEYMKAKGDAHYLEKQPDWLMEIVPNTTVKREYGIHRSAQKIIDFLHTCLKKYMEEVVYIEKDDNGVIIRELLGISKIFDPVLLEEIIQFDEDGNYDRVIAAELAIAQALKMDPIIGRISGSSDSRVQSMRKNIQNRLFLPSRGIRGKQRRLFT